MVARSGFGFKTKLIRPKESAQNNKKNPSKWPTGSKPNRTKPMIRTKPNWVYGHRESNRTRTKKNELVQKFGSAQPGLGWDSPIRVNTNNPNGFHHYFSFISHRIPLSPLIT